MHNKTLIGEKRKAGENALEPKLEAKKAHSKANYSCQFCPEVSICFPLLKKHMRNHHPKEEKNFCNICGKYFSSNFSLVKHSVAHLAAQLRDEVWDTEKEALTCPSCRSEFMTGEELQMHDCKIKNNQCHFCRQKISRGDHLKIHLVDHVKAKTHYQCSVCQWKTHRVNDYAKHMAGHSTHPKPFVCEDCQKRFKTLRELTKHKRCHDKRFEYTCPECGEVIANTALIRKHMAAKHDIRDAERRFQCDKCPSKCYTRGALEEHRKAHGNLEIAECKYCPETFSNRRLALLHQQEEHEGRVYRCEECKTKFTNQKQLDDHISKHENKHGVYLCEICDESCPAQAWRSHLRQHGRFVSQCAACNVAIDDTKVLYHKTVHLQLSTVVNKQCRLCGEMLETVEEAHKHCLEHHGLSDYNSYVLPENLISDSYPVTMQPIGWACPICGEGFTVETDWIKHIEGHIFSETEAIKCSICKGLFFDKKIFIKHLANCVKRKRHVKNPIIGKADDNGMDNALSRMSSKGRNTPQDENNETQGSFDGCTTDGSTTDVCTKEKANFNQRPVMCVLCFHFFESAEGLGYHLLTSCEQLLEEKCWRCHKEFPNIVKLNKHITEVTKPCSIMKPREPKIGRDVYPCEYCRKKFSKDSFLKMHMLQHHDPGEYSCLKCLKTFELRVLLENHLYGHAEEDQVSMFCVACGKLFDRLFDLQEHVRVHKIQAKQ